MRRESCSLVLIGFACFGLSTASADSQWGLSVTGEDNTACELKKPFRMSPPGDAIGDIWVGFYWLRNDSRVPGHTIPSNQIVLIVKAEQDFDDKPEYEEPVKAYIGEIRLRKYKFEAHVVGHAFFFADGEPAKHALESLGKSVPVEIQFELEDSSSHILRLKLGPDDKFKIYASMFLACGTAIAE